MINITVVHVAEAISCMGITDETLIKGCAKILFEKVTDKDPVPWPPKNQNYKNQKYLIYF